MRFALAGALKLRASVWSAAAGGRFVPSGGTANLPVSPSDPPGDVAAGVVPSRLQGLQARGRHHTKRSALEAKPAGFRLRF